MIVTFFFFLDALRVHQLKLCKFRFRTEWHTFCITGPNWSDSKKTSNENEIHLHFVKTFGDLIDSDNFLECGFIQKHFELNLIFYFCMLSLFTYCKMFKRTQNSLDNFYFKNCLFMTVWMEIITLIRPIRKVV